MYTDVMIPVDFRPDATLWTVARTIDHQVRLAYVSPSGDSLFAEVALRVEPYPADQHNYFTSMVNTHAVAFFGDPDEWIHGVIDGLTYFLSDRADQGQPIVGMGVALLGLREHPNDSTRSGFVRATLRAMREISAMDGALIRVGVVKGEPT
ncbi:MAG TPA: hypothetical protein VFS21_39050 [Roseiflexaceae bacterium]|nr:hypothetical protein [Roseiflexaceae bacterium]